MFFFLLQKKVERNQRSGRSEVTGAEQQRTENETFPWMNHLASLQSGCWPKRRNELFIIPGSRKQRLCPWKVEKHRHMNLGKISEQMKKFVWLGSQLMEKSLKSLDSSLLRCYSTYSHQFSKDRVSRKMGHHVPRMYTGFLQPLLSFPAFFPFFVFFPAFLSSFPPPLFGIVTKGRSADNLDDQKSQRLTRLPQLILTDQGEEYLYSFLTMVFLLIPPYFLTKWLEQSFYIENLLYQPKRYCFS